jgi:hypothetical protein
MTTDRCTETEPHPAHRTDYGPFGVRDCAGVRMPRPVDAFNAIHPVGTPVRYWKGVREGEGRISRTRTPAQMLGGHTAIVWLEGVSGGIALTHVEPLPADTPVPPRPVPTTADRMRHATNPDRAGADWPTGGRPATGWLDCAGCGDTIYPGEHVYEAPAAPGHLCAVCETKRRTDPAYDAGDAAPASSYPTTTALDPDEAAYQALTAELRQTRQHLADAHAERDQARAARNRYAVLIAASENASRLAEAEAELGLARQTIAAQAAQLRANGTLLVRLRDLDEQRDRAWAARDTVSASTNLRLPSQWTGRCAEGCTSHPEGGMTDAQD